EMRTDLSSADTLREGFTDTYAEFFTAAIRLLVRQGHAAEALEWSERARSRALLDLLASRDVSGDGDEGARDAARRRIAEATPLSSEAMRDTISRLRWTLVCYWIAPDGGMVWTMDHAGHVRARRVAMGAARLRALIESMESGALTGPATATGEPARALYDALV